MKALAEKLVKIAASIGEVPKSGFNAAQQYHYATEADIVMAVRKPLFEAGVLLFPEVTSVERVQPRGSDKQDVTALRIRFRFYDTESGESLDLNWASEGADTVDKGLAKALTNAVKYFLRDTFLIPTGDFEDEVDHATNKPTGRRVSKPAGAPRTPQAAPAPSPAQKARQEANEAVSRAWAGLASTLSESGVEVVGKDHPQHTSLMAWILGLAPQVLGHDVKRLSDLQPASIRQLGTGIANLISGKAVMPWKRAA